MQLEPAVPTTAVNGPNPSVAVLILGFNNRPYLAGALESVLSQGYPRFEVFYIDNASADGSADFVKENFPRVRVIRNMQNLGYAKALQDTLSQVFSEGYDAAVVMNADVVVDSDWLGELVASAFRDNTIGLAQPKIFLWPPHSDLINTLGNEINFLGFGFCGHFGEQDVTVDEEDREIVFPSGACFLVKKETFLKVGGFDPDFFCYVEDQDFGWRCRLFGWRSVLSAKSRLWHDYQFLPAQKQSYKLFFYERNRWFFILKNYSIGLIAAVLVPLIIFESALLIHSIIYGYLKQKVKAYCAIVGSLRTLLQKRRSIQRQRRVADKDLLPLLSSRIDFPGFGGVFIRFANLFLTLYWEGVKKCYRLCCR